MASKIRKHSYTIPCSSTLRDSVTDLAERRGVNVADLVRSVVLMVPPEAISDFPDPGEPLSGDRETVILKSGAAKGRPWQRKPRLQVRMAHGYDEVFLRRALGLMLAMDDGETEFNLAAPGANDPAPADIEELDRLRAMVSVLSFDPLAGGIATREDALHVLGFAPSAAPDMATLRARFRVLATVHHPDSGYGHHGRMSQLNSAMEMLRP